VKRVLAPMLLAAFAGGLATVVALLLLGTSSQRTVSSNSPGASSAPVATGARRDVSSTALSATQIYQRDSTGVVVIKAVTAEGEDEGTGLVLNDKGLILTNDHVVKGATSITVDASGSSKITRTAKLVGEEANQDLALISVNPSGLGLQPLTLVSSSSVQVGDPVYAIGNPYGLEETLTRGIVSALNREITAPDGYKITGAIQTDAALNPGNSGGPLLNEDGNVIGVNSQIASDAAQTEGSQPGSTGVGFAISTNTVAQAVKKIEAGEGVTYASATQGAGESEGGREQRSPYSRSPYGSQSPYGEAEASAPGSRAGGETEARSGGVEGGGAVEPSGNEGGGYEGGGTEGGGYESGGEGRGGRVVIVP
jgi:putative serine protease PepD